jgi:hypothetical protein
MKKIALPLLLTLTVILSSVSFAQWENVAPALLNVYHSDYGGAMTYKNGLVWAGYNELKVSKDSGTSWHKTSLSFGNGWLMDVQFFDEMTGVVAHWQGGAWLTRDGGDTWDNILNAGSCLSACFGKDRNTIIVANRDGEGGNVFVSHNFGAIWNKTTLEEYYGSVYHVQYHPVNGNIIALSRSVKPSHISRIYISTDQGNSWTPQKGKVNMDCYGFTFHACQKDLLYIINEDYNEQPNNFSEIYVSNDYGNSFIPLYKNNSPSLAGVGTSGDRAIFVASSEDKNIFRSIDSGKTWNSIGGPSLKEDCRSLIAINDNIILAADREGNIWRTLNSGGDPLPITPTPNGTKFALRVPKGVVEKRHSEPALVPIYLKRTLPVPTLEFKIFFDSTEYEHVGTFTLTGERVDITSESIQGRIKVRFPASALFPNGDSLIGYSQIKIHAYEPFCSQVRYDSARFDASFASCEGAPEIFGSVIKVGNYNGCGGAVYGVDDMNITSPQFTIYPNPAHEKLTLTSTVDAIDVKVFIIDVLGRTLLERKENIFSGGDLELSLSSFAVGTYYLRIETGGGVQTIRFVKE